jgi:hypothetical protein
MPFKEKIAWISVVTTVIVWGSYFAYVLATGWERPGMVYIVGFVGAVIVQAVLVASAAIVTALLAPADASAASDERDRAVAHRAYAFAYPVLLTLIVCVAASMHFGVHAIGMAYGIMAAIVVAEIVHYAAQIAGYRREY